MADAAARVPHLVYADHMLPVGKSLSEVGDKYRMLHRAVMAKGRKVPPPQVRKSDDSGDP